AANVDQTGPAPDQGRAVVPPDQRRTAGPPDQGDRSWGDRIRIDGRWGNRIRAGGRGGDRGWTDGRWGGRVWCDGRRGDPRRPDRLWVAIALRFHFQCGGLGARSRGPPWFSVLLRANPAMPRTGPAAAELAGRVPQARR